MGDINRNALTIGTATITIKVIQVSGHKMTKATFRQIHYMDYRNIPSDAEILGHIIDDGVYLLLISNGGLFRVGHDLKDRDYQASRKLNQQWKTEFPQLFIAT
jgi:hypothetical protein